MFITKTELKLYFNKSVVMCAVLLALLSLAAGLLGDKLLYGERLVPDFKLYIVDNDKTMESAMLLEALSKGSETMTVVSGASVSEDMARSAVLSGEAAAALIIPKGFFADIMSGVNSGAQLVLDERNPGLSELIRLFANSIKEQLSASQSGIYYVLSKAEDYETYTTFMNESNVIFLSLFMNRQMEAEAVSLFGSLSNKDYFTFCFYVFMMFIIPCLLIENGGKIKNGDGAAMLLSRWGSFSAMFVYKLLSVLIVFGILNIILAAFMTYTGVLSGIGAAGVLVLFALLTVIQSSICFMFIWLFSDVRTAGVFIFILGLASLFFSGGILPLNFLPEVIGRLSRITPNFYLTSLYVSLKTGKAGMDSAFYILAFSAAALLVSYFAAYSSARRERLA